MPAIENLEHFGGGTAYAHRREPEASGSGRVEVFPSGDDSAERGADNTGGVEIWKRWPNPPPRILVHTSCLAFNDDPRLESQR